MARLVPAAKVKATALAAPKSDKVVLKKRGLTIVKKKRPKPQEMPSTPAAKKQKMASILKWGNRVY